MPTVEELKRLAEPPVVVADDQGLIVFVNAAFERVFGWSSAEALGQPLSMIIPPTLRHAHHLGFARFQATGQGSVVGRALKLRAIDKSGREFDAEHFIVAENSADGWRFAATLRPLG